MEEFFSLVLFSLFIIVLVIIGMWIYEPKPQVQYDKHTIEKYYYFNCSNIQSKDCEILEKYKNKEVR